MLQPEIAFLSPNLAPVSFHFEFFQESLSPPEFFIRYMQDFFPKLSQEIPAKRPLSVTISPEVFAEVVQGFLKTNSGKGLK